MTSERRPFLLWLLVITVVGCALRTYLFTQIPFTYDELSALNRTHFNNFSQLIQLGVAGDGHPAGVQVFLYYWTRLFGDREWVVKLPFILIGILCIPLVYHIGATWFNRNTGLVAACFIAGLQYTIMYSQIARPYVSGMFFILLLVVVWNAVMKTPTWRNLAMLAILLALNAYNHYFSLLTAGCIATTGFLVIDRKYLTKYIVTLLLSAALFLPHLHLFFAQLKLGGLEWVPVPKPGFFKNYLYYVINFSNYILAITFLLFAQGIYLIIKRKPPVAPRFRLIALLWFVIPAMVGYLYSVYRAPVLQNSVLIFGFPFLVLFVCSFITLPDSCFGDIAIGALLLTLVLSLTVERNYYHFFYHAETEMMARHIAGYEAALGNNKVAAVVNTNPLYLNYYKNKYPSDWKYTTFDSIGDAEAWRKWLQKSDARYLVLCNPPQEWGAQYLPIAEKYFPCIDSVYGGFTTDVIVLKKDISLCKPQPQPIFSYVLNDSLLSSANYNFNQALESGTMVNARQFSDGSRALTFEPINKMGLNSKCIITVSAEVYIDSASPPVSLILLFGDKQDPNKTLQARKSMVQDFAAAGSGWHSVYLTARLHHCPNLKDIGSISADLIGRPDAHILVKNFKFVVLPDNPVLYVMIEK